jgi:hypothetical protein
MKLKIINLTKPSNKKFKLVADIALYTLPFYLSAIMLLTIPEDVKMWVNFATTMVIVTLKAITKFTAEADVNNNK